MTDEPGLTELIARTALDVSAADLPAAGQELIRAALLDCLVCTVAGSRTETARIMAGWLADSGGRPDSTVVGTGLRLPAAAAALANGVAGHALDFDDVSVRMIHPSVTLVPAVWALAEARGASGAAVLDAYLAGFEVEARLCGVLNPDHYEDGWHTTGTIGVFGATAAAARLCGLDLDRTRVALGIAGSAAAGIRANAGTMVKPLHAGQAAFHGVQAAALAERGFTATRTAFEAGSGVLHVFGKDDAAGALRAVFAPGAPIELVTGGIAFKRFTCCGAIHTALDALLGLVEEHELAAADVTRMVVRVNRLVPGILTHHVTSDPLQGKFSLEYSLAVTLADGAAGLQQYTTERAADPALRELMGRVEVLVDDEIPVAQAYFASDLTVELRDGRSVRRRVDVAKGYPDNPLSAAELAAKGRSCCAGILADGTSDELAAALADLASVPDVRALAGLLRGD